MYDIIRVILRALISLFTLFFVTKIIGKKQVSELSLFDYVIGISIGNFAAEMTINLDSHYLHGTVAVIVFGIVAYLISIVTMKSIFLRRFFMGIPTILIEKGVLLETGLKKIKFDVNDLLEQCREQGYFDISKIEYAIMEADGKISILPKKEESLVTVSDLKIEKKYQGICANVIIDGKIMHQNLKNMGKDETWLNKKLLEKKTQIKDILLGTLDDNNQLNLYYKSSKKAKDVLE